MSFYTRGIQRDTSLNKGVLKISSDTYGGNTWPPRANILPVSIVFHELHLVVLSFMWSQILVAWGPRVVPG